jgi:phenylalanyl-tRNA synthetase beta chain
MGGEFSGIYGDTQTVIFESASFRGPSVRTTAQKLGMRTESSGRFEKGLDPENALPALLRACQLVELLDAGTVCDDFIDVRVPSQPMPTLPLDADWINTFLGTDIPAEDMVAIFRRLDFAVENGMVTPPSYRRDVAVKADLAEEIARIYGYNNIPSTALRGVAEGMVSPQRTFEQRMEKALVGQGYYGLVTYSFISPKSYDKIRLPENSPLRDSVVISNPLGEDTSVMRTTAIPSLLEVLARNYHNRVPAANLYEIATSYLPTQEGKLPAEPTSILFGSYGENADFFSLKGMAEILLEQAGIPGVAYEAVADNDTFHPGRCARIKSGEAVLGLLGEIHPQVCENYDIGVRVYVAELNLSALFANAATEITVKPLPRFPVSTRDLALVADEAVPVGDMAAAITAVAGSLLEKLELFDVYRGKQVGEGKKSVAYSLTLRAPDRTLTDEECDRMVKKILAKLSEIGVELRA